MNNKQTNPPKLFHFKRFSLSDSLCGMKIGTDGVLLGSIAAGYPSGRTLDAGTGCGLIALMVAQKNNGQITALDIDPAAIRQASENFIASPWADRIQVVHSSLQDYSQNSTRQFDLIVCNPPFFHNSLQSKCNQRNTARHSSLLPPGELVAAARKLLSEKGRLLLIIPADQDSLYNELVKEHSLYITGRLWIISAPGKPPKRLILEISGKNNITKEISLVVEMKERHTYSDEYKTLTRDYYLNF